MIEFLNEHWGTVSAALVLLIPVAIVGLRWVAGKTKNTIDDKIVSYLDKSWKKGGEKAIAAAKGWVERKAK